jgi:hypothetical protein
MQYFTTLDRNILPYFLFFAYLLFAFWVRNQLDLIQFVGKASLKENREIKDCLAEIERSINNVKS